MTSVKGRPRKSGEEEFGIAYLPGEEVGDALLSARPYHQICIIQHNQHLREQEIKRRNTSTRSSGATHQHSNTETMSHVTREPSCTDGFTFDT